jgi:hypothetical protein
MMTSETTGAVLPAMLAATTQIGHGVRKSSQGHGYRYADLASLLELVRPALESHGLVLVSSQPAPDIVVTRCYHAPSGEWVEVTACVSADGESSRKGGPQGAQAAGSAYTYGRRYSIMALLNIAGEDDDGAATRPASKQAPATAKSAPTFSPAEIEHAIKQGWEAPAGWPAASQARYRADLDSGAVVIS